MASERALHNKVLLGLVIGAVGGVLANSVGGKGNKYLLGFINHVTDPVGTLFLRLLLMTVIPLVFSSLLLGVARIGNVRQLGRVGLKCFIYCLIISGISVVIGLTLANTVQPGKRISKTVADRLQVEYGSDANKRVAETKKSEGTDSPFMAVVKGFVPSNPIAAIASDPPNMLHWIFFTLALGVAVNLVGTAANPFVRGMEALFAASAKLIDLIMLAAPFAVACLLFSNTARFGLDLLIALGWFVVIVLLGLSLHMFGTYSLSVRLLSRISPREFFRRIRTVIVTAFSTSSSNATLPTTLRVSEENLGVPREINSFVLTLGATANQNGTALYEGVTVLFLAQLAGVDLSLGQQIMVAYLAILGSIGTAGVPSGSIPFIIVVLGTVNVDPGLIGVILGVDRILDMCRTTVNVVGDITAATYVARSEGFSLLPATEKAG